jgi:hypothetical protein
LAGWAPPIKTGDHKRADSDGSSVLDGRTIAWGALSAIDADDMPAREVLWRTKLLYGVGDIAINIKNTSLNQFLLFFYVDVVRVAPELIGVALFVGKVWDAFSDPIVGYLSDTTRSRWGRRRPYVLFAALPMAVCYYLLFVPPAGSGWMTVVYLVSMFMLLDTFFTCFGTPYMAWGAELARDYHERTVVVQVRGLFGIVGGVLGATLPVLIVADGALQENPIEEGAKLRIPKLPEVAAPQGDSGAVAETARMLVNAEHPVLIADRYARTQEGNDRLVELAELLQCAVVDTSSRLNMPSRHPLNQSGRARGQVRAADIILGLEMNDYWASLNSYRDQLHP